MIECTCGLTLTGPDDDVVDRAFEAHVNEEFRLDGSIRHFNVAHL